MTIRLSERFGPVLVSRDDGIALREEVVRELASGEEVDLDFAGVRVAIASFLNAAIGGLYESFEADDVERRVRLHHLSRVMESSVENVRDHAKRFYADPVYRERHLASKADIA